MAVRLSSWLTSVSTGPVTLILFLILVAFIILVLPGQAASAGAASHGAGSPDTSLWYSPADLYRMADAYGAVGRQAYVQARFTFDIVWPLVYVSGLTAALSWLLGRAAAPDSRWRLANLTPIAGGLLDLGENVTASLVMIRYPSLTPAVDGLAPVLTLAKWIVLGVAFLILAGAATRVLLKTRAS